VIEITRGQNEIRKNVKIPWELSCDPNNLIEHCMPALYFSFGSIQE